MSRLNWGAVGERTYELGVDRGVLYIDDGDGIAWNGLISVSEDPSGGEIKPYYLDGFKYLNRSAIEEFEGTIEAYTYPDEFALCDGTSAIGNGLFATQQRRRSFGLAYRSRVGNDVNGPDHGYKIHLVYGAKAEPSSRVHSTMSDTLEPYNFSWKFKTKPPKLVNTKPTSHFVIDSRETPSPLLQTVEDILYGTDLLAPRMPSVHELRFLFTTYLSSEFDAGSPGEESYLVFDGEGPSSVHASTIDGGAP